MDCILFIGATLSFIVYQSSVSNMFHEIWGVFIQILSRDPWMSVTPLLYNLSSPKEKWETLVWFFDIITT